MKPLYSWQQDCLSLWFQNDCRGVVGVATGAGKTRLALEAAARLMNAPSQKNLCVRVVVPRVFLALQWKSEIASYFGMPEREIGLWFGGRKDKPDRLFMVYVLDSARTCISRHILDDVRSGHTVFLVCDEAHHFGSTENAHVFDFFPHVPKGIVFSLGLSATPEAERFADIIAPAIGPVFFRYGIEEATRHQITAPYQLFNVAIPFSSEEQAEYADATERIARAEYALLRICPHFFAKDHADYIRKLNQLIREGGRVADAAERLKRLYFLRKRILVLAEARVTCGIELVRLLSTECKTILFSERIVTANMLFENLSTLFPEKIGLYHSAMRREQKEFALSRYREGRTRILVCCRALDEGLNVPDTAAAVMVSSSSGELQRVQRMGRVLRNTQDGITKRIFHIYVPDTAESPDFLSGMGGKAERLFFNEKTNGLVHKEYDKFSNSAIRQLRKDGATENQITIALRQIEVGRIAADWQLTPELIETRLDESKKAGSREKNYWAMMLLISRERMKQI